MREKTSENDGEENAESIANFVDSANLLNSQNLGENQAKIAESTLDSAILSQVRNCIPRINCKG